MTRPPVRDSRRAAFTLIEVLVVMGIIVLLIALALPAFNFITGSRSNEAASNQISAAMGIARAHAVGLQKVFGIMFFIEPSSDHIQMALVQETSRPPGPPGDTDANATLANSITTYLDLVPNTEFVKLPTGVGLQTVTNGLGATSNDRYVGFNTAGVPSGGSAFTESTTKLKTRVGGVILFDANGQLTARTYALRTRVSSTVPTLIGALLYSPDDSSAGDAASMANTPADYIPASTLASAPVSQLGLVLYDASVFNTKGFTLGDYRADATASPLTGEQAEEQWLDDNATPTMINRYNGTLVRGE